MCVSNLSRGEKLLCSRLLTVAVNGVERSISQGQIVIFSLSFLCVLGVTCWGVVIPETASATLHSGMGDDRIIKWVRRLLKITCTCYKWDIRHWSLLSYL